MNLISCALDSLQILQMMKGGNLLVKMEDVWVKAGDKVGKKEREERQVDQCDVISPEGVKIWQLLPLAEGEAKRVSNGAGAEELAFRRGDRIVVKRRGDEEGWVWAERKDLMGRGDGLVRQADIKLLPHSSDGVFEWRQTHTIVFPHPVKSLAHFGSSSSFLAAASGRNVCLLLRNPCGFQGYIDADSCPLNCSHELVGGAPRPPDDWTCVDMLQGHSFSAVHALAAADFPGSSNESALLVSGGGDRKASVWELTKWAAALRARELPVPHWYIAFFPSRTKLHGTSHASYTRRVNIGQAPSLQRYQLLSVPHRCQTMHPTGSKVSDWCRGYSRGMAESVAHREGGGRGTEASGQDAGGWR